MTATAEDFSALLMEGVAVNAYSESQLAELEQLHHDYVCAVRAMKACLDSMDQQITLAKRNAA